MPPAYFWSCRMTTGRSSCGRDGDGHCRVPDAPRLGPVSFRSTISRPMSKRKQPREQSLFDTVESTETEAASRDHASRAALLGGNGAAGQTDSVALHEAAQA